MNSFPVHIGSKNTDSGCKYSNVQAVVKREKRPMDITSPDSVNFMASHATRFIFSFRMSLTGYFQIWHILSKDSFSDGIRSAPWHLDLMIRIKAWRVYFRRLDKAC